jgi:uncharacterized YigZ family protein
MKEKDLYRTIRNPSTGNFRTRGSRFIAFAYQVETVDQVHEILGQLRREHHNAKHHCFAYRLGAAKLTFRENDDGEPANSAGKPILGQIRAFDLSNILVVVVRYFGGTLLGVSGLINAYRSAASEALGNAEIILMTERKKIIIHFPYPATNNVMRILHEEEMNILKKEFSESCLIEASVRKSHVDRVRKRLEKLEQVKVFNSY